jgi:hypothetical protein
MTTNVTSAILAGLNFEHDLETRVESHPRTTEEQDRDAALCSEFFAAGDSKISQIREDAIFHAAAILAAGVCEDRGENNPAYHDRLTYHFAAEIAQRPMASGLSPEEIAEKAELASFAAC